MSKRKGLSLEEKRDKVLEVFTDSADVFVLKVRVSQLGSVSEHAQGTLPYRNQQMSSNMPCSAHVYLCLGSAGCREDCVQEGCGPADHQGSAAGEWLQLLTPARS